MLKPLLRYCETFIMHEIDRLPPFLYLTRILKMMVKLHCYYLTEILCVKLTTDPEMLSRYIPLDT